MLLLRIEVSRELSGGGGALQAQGCGATGTKPGKGISGLLLACLWMGESSRKLLLCNSTYKGALFPLSDPETRARSHHDELDAEDPLLVDPASEDPRQHIRFRGSACEPLTGRGRETIRVLGLKRSDLEEDRRERLAILDALREAARLEEIVGGARVERARDILERAVRPEAEYSSMARYFLEPDNG